MKHALDTPSADILWRLLGLSGALLLSAALLMGCNKQPSSRLPAAEPHMQPQAPIKLPIPLDKAGYKIDTTFWIIPPDPPRSYFVGLNIPFTAGDGTRIELMDAHPVKAKVTLHRVEESGAETKQVLRMPVRVSAITEPSKYEWIALPDDEAYTRGNRSYRLSYRPEDKYQLDGAIRELEFGFAGKLPQGQYRLRVELLEDKPALKDMPAYLVLDYVGHAK